MKKSVFRGITNLKNRFRFAEYGRDIYIHPKAVISRPKYMAVGDSCRVGAFASIYLHPLKKDHTGPLLVMGNGVFVGIRAVISVHYRVELRDNVLLGTNVLLESTLLWGLIL